MSCSLSPEDCSDVRSSKQGSGICLSEFAATVSGFALLRRWPGVECRAPARPAYRKERELD